MKNIAKLTLAVLAATTFLTAPVEAASAGTVNVNTATAEQLSLLPRVGPSLAAKILDYREENGQFKQVEDLLLVSGIGDKMFGLIEPFVRTSGETTLKTKIKAGSLAKKEDGKKEDGKKDGGKPAKEPSRDKSGSEGEDTPAAEGAAEGGR